MILLSGYTSGLLAVASGCVGIGFQFGVHSAVNAVCREESLFIPFTGRMTHQQFNAFPDVCYRINVEHAVFHRFNHVIVQHQISDIGYRNQHALCAGQSPFSAKCKEPFDFLVYTADGLNLTLLVNRAGYRQILTDWQISQRRDNAVQFGTGCAVAINAVIVLLKAPLLCR